MNTPLGAQRAADAGRQAVADRDELIAKAQARAEKAEYQLHIVDRNGNGVFLLSKWNLTTRELRGLDAVTAFLDRVAP